MNNQKIEKFNRFLFEKKVDLLKKNRVNIPFREGIP